jgi:putative transposase
MKERLQAAYHANRGVYGSPRLHAELQAQGIRCSRKRVARLMGELGLRTRRPRHRTRTTRSEASAPVAYHLLQRDFTASRAS